MDNKNNTGNWNSGYYNSGNYNSGDYNSGNYNSGNSNSGYYNSGYRNRPNFLYFDLCVWVSDTDMTDEEKAANPEYHVRGGYLKTLEYTEAFQKSWDEPPEEDRKKLFDLPNFDAEVFKEISGIDVTKYKKSCAGKVVEIDGKKYKLQEI